MTIKDVWRFIGWPFVKIYRFVRWPFVKMYRLFRPLPAPESKAQSSSVLLLKLASKEIARSSSSDKDFEYEKTIAYKPLFVIAPKNKARPTEINSVFSPRSPEEKAENRSQRMFHRSKTVGHIFLSDSQIKSRKKRKEIRYSSSFTKGAIPRSK